jgi:hypothetical protein
VQGSYAWRADSAVFDEHNLVSHAGLVPVMELAEQAGLSQLLDQHVRFTCERVKSGAANPTGNSEAAGSAVRQDLQRSGLASRARQEARGIITTAIESLD